MYVADTLSRAPLPEVNACSFSANLETVDHVSMLTIEDNHVQRISMHQWMILYFKCSVTLL